MPAPFTTPVASSVPYDQAATGRLPAADTDVQAAIDELALGALTDFVTEATSIATSSATYAQLGNMTKTIPSGGSGNWRVFFDGNFVMSGSGSDTFVSVFKNGVQVADSERKQTAGAGTHSMILVCSTTLACVPTDVLTIQWKTGGSVTATGRSMFIQKVR